METLEVVYGGVFTVTGDPKPEARRQCYCGVNWLMKRCIAHSADGTVSSRFE